MMLAIDKLRTYRVCRIQQQPIQPTRRQAHHQSSIREQRRTEPRDVVRQPPRQQRLYSVCTYWMAEESGRAEEAIRIQRIQPFSFSRADNKSYQARERDKRIKPHADSTCMQCIVAWWWWRRTLDVTSYATGITWCESNITTGVMSCAARRWLEGATQVQVLYFKAEF